MLAGDQRRVNLCVGSPGCLHSRYSVPPINDRFLAIHPLHPEDNHMAPARPLAERQNKYFSIEEANRSLPLVKAIVEDIVRQSRLVDNLQQRIARVTRESRRPSDDPYSEELAQTQNELEVEGERLQSYVDELKNLGVELKSDEIGLCDFRSLMNGREIYLCWRLGEPAVMYWHELDAGFSGRQKLRIHAESKAADERR